MIDVFRGLKNLIKVSHVHIDSTIFRLHYTFTVMCLLAFSLIVTTRQYVGNPIDCVHTKDIPEDVLNTYCWIHSTYTIPSAFWKRIGIDVAHPGIDKTIDPEERRYVKYYQWVCFCLFFQVRFSSQYFSFLTMLMSASLVMFDKFVYCSTFICVRESKSILRLPRRTKRAREN